MAVDMKRKLTFNLFHVNSCEKKNKKPEQNKQHLPVVRTIYFLTYLIIYRGL